MIHRVIIKEPVQQHLLHIVVTNYLSHSPVDGCLGWNIFPILQRKELSPREFQCFGEGHEAKWQQSQNLKLPPSSHRPSWCVVKDDSPAQSSWENWGTPFQYPLPGMCFSPPYPPSLYLAPLPPGSQDTGTNQRGCLARHPLERTPALGFPDVLSIQQVTAAVDRSDGLWKKWYHSRRCKAVSLSCHRFLAILQVQLVLCLITYHCVYIMLYHVSHNKYMENLSLFPLAPAQKRTDFWCVLT